MVTIINCKNCKYIVAILFNQYLLWLFLFVCTSAELLPNFILFLFIFRSLVLFSCAGSLSLHDNVCDREARQHVPRLSFSILGRTGSVSSVSRQCSVLSFLTSWYHLFIHHRSLLVAKMYTIMTKQLPVKDCRAKIRIKPALSSHAAFGNSSPVKCLGDCTIVLPSVGYIVQYNIVRLTSFLKVLEIKGFLEIEVLESEVRHTHLSISLSLYLSLSMYIYIYINTHMFTCLQLVTIVLIVNIW